MTQWIIGEKGSTMSEITSKSTGKKGQADGKEKNTFAFKDWPLIPAGVYKAVCFHYEIGISHLHSQKLFLHFRIIEEGPYYEKMLFMAINMADNKGRIKKSFGQRSKLYESWVIANFNQRPDSTDSIEFRIFINSIFEVKVRTTKPKYNDGSEKPGCFHYSIIDRLTTRLA